MLFKWILLLFSCVLLTDGKRNFPRTERAIKKFVKGNLDEFKRKLQGKLEQMNANYALVKKRQSSKHLKNCVEVLEGHLANIQRKVEVISSKVKNVWLASNSKKIPSLKVNGRIFSKKRNIISKVQLDFKTSAPSPVSLKEMTKKTENRIKLRQKDLEAMLSKSGKQSIKSKSIFLKNVTVVKGEIDELNSHVTLNRMPTDRSSSILRIKGNQVVQNKMSLTNLLGVKSTLGFINNNRIEDFVLLNTGNMPLTGSYVFQNASASTVFVKGAINGQKIDNFVLTSKKQDIQDIKEFKGLSVKNLETKSLLGEINLDALKKATKDSLIYPSALNFSSKLIIEGNLNVTSLNDNDILQLFSKTVKTNEKQDITGKIRFKSMNIRGNVTSSGKINTCILDQFLTTNTNQSIYVNVEFPNTVAFQNILTNSVNGIDLSQQAVIKSRKNVIKGRKSFTKNLKVSSISLKEGIHIDSFDPSVEDVQTLKKNDVEVWSTFSLGRVNIRNINAKDVEVDVNSFPQLKELDNVWLRSTEQHITSVIETKDMHVKKKLGVSRVNNLTMDDLVIVKGNAAIQGAVHFTEEVYTKTLNLGENSNVNFSPEYWNRQKVKIANNITIEKAVLKENLTVDGTLRNFEPGFMHVKNNQTINGLVHFEKVQAKNLSFKHFNFSIMNTINITDFLDRAVVAPIRNKSIHNKHFKVLNGYAMTWSEVLNNVSLGKIVLKNKNQSILSPWTFLKAPSFKNVKVNNFFDGIKVGNIICTDEVAVINNKQFNGNITTKNVYASGLLNRVNISSLHQEAFYKTKVNTLKKKLIFKENVTTYKIQVAANKIDNVNLKDTIRLSASTEFKSLNASNITVPNITIAGLINGCDVELIVKNAFTAREPKYVTAYTVVKSLVIEGNVKIKYLMGENFSSWISFLKMTSSEEIERNLEFESLKANSMMFLQPLNNMTVGFLLGDAVKKNENQNITSQKIFQGIHARKSLILTLNSSKVDGIIANEMFDSYINKTENRTFTLLNPSIKSLVAKQVNITGTLNDLILPNDVVLSNVDETIESEVNLNTTSTSLGLTIHGKINGIDLENFLRKRVTLNSTQEISSSLDFNENIDLRGNTGLNGTINNVRLENALRKQANRTIFGLKNFTNTLEISSDVAVNGSVNGVNLEQFLWSSRNETVKEVQFLKRINATDMICNTINGVDVSGLYNYTHITVHEVNDSLDNLTSDILSLQDSLRSQKEAVENPLSLFSYFELHEIIKFGPVLKFLPVYEYGMIGEKHELQVTQMVMWVSKKVKSCRKVESFIASFTTGETLNVTKKMRGKVFPFSLQIETEGLVGFHVQAEDARKCTPAIKSLLIKAEFSSDNVSNSRISLPEGADLVDVQLLELSTDLFLMAAFNIKDPGERIFTFHYDLWNNSWSQHQQFHEQNLTSLEFILVEREEMSLFDPPDVYLSVTGDKKNPGVMVYEWNYDVGKFDFKTNLSTTASTHALWLDAHRNLYLILAKEKIEVTRNHTKVDVFNEPLEVYTLDEDELVLNHIVNIKGISFIESFTLAGEIYLLAASSHMEVVYILQFRGYNGFEVIQEIQAAGVTEARVFTVDNQLYLALNSKTIQSRILKASVHGGKLFVPEISSYL